MVVTYSVKHASTIIFLLYQPEGKMMKHKWIAVLLIGLLALLQFRLWFGKNSISDYQKMQSQISTLEQQNANLQQRNSLLKADIQDLQLGIDSMEERARNELGLIKEGETFYRILPKE
jgi:cell division protein FtsB